MRQYRNPHCGHYHPRVPRKLSNATRGTNTPVDGTNCSRNVLAHKLFQRSKWMAQEANKTAPRSLNSYGENIQYLKVHDRSLQDGSRWPPRLTQDASRTANIAQYNLRDESKMVEMAQKGPNITPKWPLRISQDASKTAKMPQYKPRVAQEALKRPPPPFSFFLPLLLFLLPRRVPRTLSKPIRGTRGPIAWQASGHDVRPHRRFPKGRGRR